MRSKFTTLLTIAVAVSVITIIIGNFSWTNSSSANRDAQERKKRNLKDEVLTVIDAAPEEVDAEKKAARIKKNKRFNKSKRASLLEETKDGEYAGTFLESPPPPPLPTNSDLIVVGSIQRRQPYLSENVTSVYTEFTVHIEEILKNHISSPVYSFEPLTMNREGGAIRMPNGRVFGYLVAPIGSMPEVGKRYVLFLQYEAERDYKLVVGYELTDTRIIPLEDFADREPLLNLTEAQFLSLLKQKMSQTQPEKEN